MIFNAKEISLKIVRKKILPREFFQDFIFYCKKKVLARRRKKLFYYCDKICFIASEIVSVIKRYLLVVRIFKGDEPLLLISSTRKF